MDKNNTYRNGKMILRYIDKINEYDLFHQLNGDRYIVAWKTQMKDDNNLSWCQGHYCNTFQDAINLLHTRANKDEYCHIYLYDDEFDEDVWENYCKILGISNDSAQVKIPILKSEIKIFA